MRCAPPRRRTRFLLQYPLVSLSTLPCIYICRRLKYEKRIADSNGCLDDDRADWRFGRNPRLCWRWGILRCWLVWALLGTILGSLRLLCLPTSWSNQAGYQGERRPGVHQWRLRRDDA